MPRKATDPIVETHNFGALQIKTTRKGWLGTDSYEVKVTASHRETGESVTLTNTGAWDSPAGLRRRAREQMTS